ncbi:MAG: hypothetical protein M5R36_26585 [Deltaproteobacteria bacterium]|nr:hypothetical protein [Deltaproteobacteria bacterium]
MNASSTARCLYCGAELHVVWVHGHGQCAHCGTNIAPCCDGDTCRDDAPP